MRGTVAKRHRHRGASQKTCQQRSERLRGLGVAPTVRGDELGLEQQLRGHGVAPTVRGDELGLEQQLRGTCCGRSIASRCSSVDRATELSC